MYSSKTDWVAMNSRSDLHSSSWRRSVTKQYVKCPLRWNMLYHNLIFFYRSSIFSETWFCFSKMDNAFQNDLYDFIKYIFFNSLFIYFYFYLFLYFYEKVEKKFGFDKCMLLISIKSCPVLPITSNFETAVTCLWHV